MFAVWWKAERQLKHARMKKSGMGEITERESLSGTILAAVETAAPSGNSRQLCTFGHAVRKGRIWHHCANVCAPTISCTGIQ
jgi:hypothetical protein